MHYMYSILKQPLIYENVGYSQVFLTILEISVLEHISSNTVASLSLIKYLKVESLG